MTESNTERGVEYENGNPNVAKSDKFDKGSIRHEKTDKRARKGSPTTGYEN